MADPLAALKHLMILAYGPTTLACALSWILLGINLQQLVTYATLSWRKDPALLCAAIALVGLLTTCSSVISLAALWTIALKPIVTLGSYLPLLATRFGFITTRFVVAQLVFEWRLARLSGWRVFCGMLGLASSAIFFMSIIPLARVSSGYGVARIAGSNATNGFDAVRDWSSAALEAFLAIDVVIVASMTYTLWSLKRKTTNPHTESLLTRIAANTISNAGVCCLLNLAAVIALRLQPTGATIHDLFSDLSSSVLEFSLLYSLNQRASLAHTYDPSQLTSLTSGSKRSKPVFSPPPNLVDFPASPSTLGDEKSWGKEREPQSHSLDELHGSTV